MASADSLFPSSVCSQTPRDPVVPPVIASPVDPLRDPVKAQQEAQKKQQVSQSDPHHFVT